MSLHIPDDYLVESHSFKIELTLHTDIDNKIMIEVDTLSGNLSIPKILSLTSVEACLAGCAVATLIGPLISCFINDIDKYKACLKSKGLDLLSDAVKCAIGCAASTVGGP